VNQNDEGRLHSAPASPTTCTEDTSGVGCDYPRCPSCGKRFPAAEDLERHRARAGVGPVGERRVVLRRLRPNERAAFARRLSGARG
jgi:hypothetical protein